MDNKFFMPLNIQMFADEGNDMVTDTETSGENGDAQKDTQNQSNSSNTNTGKTYTRDELNKIVNAEREKIKAELLEEAKNQKNEAEKLAKMDTEQKLNYELETARKEAEKYKSQVNSLTLKTEATSYANQKGLPIGYIEDLDYAHETAESIKQKIDKFTELRSKDLDNYLKDKLKQNPPKAVDDNKTTSDPYLKGFNDYFANKKR
ncbi:MAG TPA: DUF4355 domain-containing protein [Candidatus Coprosoma intestinipullorum]|uniref:DUF4355 domain-containing protein n=1 Tax=Candidatus Coprosoma intestinipullorum TaxID=2840752 RepID=A0A9D1CYR3_9FIRM|nr:DUF4355 domain-containing protein [Candidatus Coprosoma intestinipullorum]